MRPCQHCNAPLENHLHRCPACGLDQVQTVGIEVTPNDESVLKPMELESREDAAARRVILCTFAALVLFLTVVGWLQFGLPGLMVGLVSAVILSYVYVALMRGVA
jgi:hypothetical protein